MTNSKKWSDEEIVADVDYLKAQLQDIKKTLTYVLRLFFVGNRRFKALVFFGQ